MEVGGTASIEGDAEAKSVEIGGYFKSKSLKVDTAELSGVVSTADGIFARGRVMVNKRTRVTGWIKSLDTITVESRAIVDSILRPQSSSRGFSEGSECVSEELEVEGNVMVTGDFLYSSNLRLIAS